jgi:hypothetical protein
MATTATTTIDRNDATKFGVSVDVSSDVESARQQIEAVFQSHPFNEGDVECYRKACREVPHLVVQESNPLSFLKCCDGDMVQAATRIATYWRKRCELFGSQALRPLGSLTGTDALSLQDIEFLKTGTFSKLPTDALGRSVLCMDRDRVIIKSEDWLMREQRCIFYLLHVIASEHALSYMDNGVSLLWIIRELNIDEASAKQTVDLLRDTFPVRFAPVSVFIIPPREQKRAVFNKNTRIIVKTLFTA